MPRKKKEVKEQGVKESAVDTSEQLPEVVEEVSPFDVELFDEAPAVVVTVHRRVDSNGNGIAAFEMSDGSEIQREGLSHDDYQAFELDERDFCDKAAAFLKYCDDLSLQKL